MQQKSLGDDIFDLRKSFLGNFIKSIAKGRKVWYNTKDDESGFERTHS